MDKGVSDKTDHSEDLSSKLVKSGHSEGEDTGVDKESSSKGLGDAFKPPPDSWECKECYVRNKGCDSKCVACSSPNPSQAGQGTAESKPISQTFTFGIPSTEGQNVVICNPEPKTKVDSLSGFGDKFKPAPDTWECKECFVRNKSCDSKCVACSTPNPSGKTDTAAPKQSTCEQKFSFGVSTDSKVTNQTTGFGDKFKPAPDTWECKECFVRNKSSEGKCVACSSPNPSGPSSASEPAQKFKFGTPSEGGFSFGITSETGPKKDSSTSGFGDKFKPPADTWECKECYIRNKTTDSKCVACSSPNPSGVTSSPAQKQTFTFGVTQSVGEQKFSFGINPESKTNSEPSNDSVLGEKSKLSETPNKPAEPSKSTFTFGVSQPLESKTDTKFDVDPLTTVSGGNMDNKANLNQWECRTCSVKNKNSDRKCVGCGTTKADKSPEIMDVDTSDTDSKSNTQTEANGSATEEVEPEQPKPVRSTRTRSSTTRTPTKTSKRKLSPKSSPSSTKVAKEATPEPEPKRRRSTRRSYK